MKKLTIVNLIEILNQEKQRAWTEIFWIGGYPALHKSQVVKWNSQCLMWDISLNVGSLGEFKSLPLQTILLITVVAVCQPEWDVMILKMRHALVANNLKSQNKTKLDVFPLLARYFIIKKCYASHWGRKVTNSFILLGTLSVIITLQTSCVQDTAVAWLLWGGTFYSLELRHVSRMEIMPGT